MIFKDSQSVLATINAGQEVEIRRAANRVIVNDMFNGEKPMSDAEAEQMNQAINVNWGEAPVLHAQALRQFTNAFQRPFRYFKVSIPEAPPEKQAEWGMKIGGYINRVMKKSNEYFYLTQYQNSSVVSHGIGPAMWEDDESWIPRYVALEDLRVPTETEVSFRNLEWFAVRYRYTEGELAMKVWSKEFGKGWNKKAIAPILEEYRDKTYEMNETWLNQPERIAELIKQNGGYYTSDAVPSIPLWHFYFKKREDGETTWLLRIVPDTLGGCVGANGDDFLFDSGNKSYANDLSEILHCQFGDMNTKAPFMYHSVRSLGFLLVEPCFYTNLARSKALQYLFESFQTWFRVVDPAGRARATKIELASNAIVPEGVSIVTADQRHQVQPGLIEMVWANLKQLQSEASASYTQASDTGTSREQTAYETSVKVAQVNAMMSGMLLVAFFQKKFEYQEICRRFCIKNSSCPDVKKFREKMKQAKIPERFLDVDMWDIDPEVPLGAGNPTMELSQANQLFQARGAFNPQAQQEILNQWTASVSQNPALANRWAPINPKDDFTSGEKWAAAIFGSLMHGIPIQQNTDVPAMEQVETLLGLLAGVLARVEGDPESADRNEVAGFKNVAMTIGQLIQQMAADQANTEKMKEYAQSLGKLVNVIKTVEKQVLQKEQNGKVDPAVMADIQAKQMKSQNDIAIKQAKTQQQLEQKNTSFRADQDRKNATLIADQQRKSMDTAAQLQRDGAVTASDLLHERARTVAEIGQETMKTQAEIERENRKASQSGSDEE